MNTNETFCFIDETKMTETEWEEAHADEVAYHRPEIFGYFYCDSYAAYSASFDRCMEMQIRNRESLRNWYRKMVKTPYTPEFVQECSDFSDSFKSVFGYRPKFLETVLAHKGTTVATYRADMDKAIEAWEASFKKEG